MTKIIACSILMLSLGCLSALGADPQPEDAATRYTFTWPLTGSAPAPRGGSTRGVPVTPETTPSVNWRALQAPGLTAFERDRRAILAMAGEYRVTFDFLEVATFQPGAKRDRPYQSWGTERVYVDEDKGRFISLVHILEMRVIQKDGSISDPLIQKHWRQDWQYQPSQLVEFAGFDRWQTRSLPATSSKGEWSQTVDQVDESPRYASLGRWVHSTSFSTWISGQTWRPLPRREFSIRKDYQVLAGTNRVTVTAGGWLQEEDNLKMVLKSDRTVDSTQPYRSREYGVARYEPLHNADFAGATEYYERTRAFWDQVHATWGDLYRRNQVLTLPATDGNVEPSQQLSDYAEELAAGHASTVPAAKIIAEALAGIGKNPPQ